VEEKVGVGHVPLPLDNDQSTAVGRGQTWDGGTSFTKQSLGELKNEDIVYSAAKWGGKKELRVPERKC